MGRKVQVTRLYVTGMYSFGGWIFRRTTVQAHLLLRSRFGKQRKQPSAVTWWKGTRRLAGRQSGRQTGRETGR
jgi:hypothetical protein